MTDYASYERILTNKVIVTWIMCSILISFLIGFGIYFFIAIRRKELPRIVMLPMAVLLLFTTGGGVITTVNCELDKQQKAYIVYEGEFSYGPKNYVFLGDPEKANRSKTRLTANLGRAFGDYSGVLLYSKRSKLLVACRIDGELDP